MDWASLVKPILDVLSWLWARLTRRHARARPQLPVEMLRAVPDDRRFLRWHTGRNTITNERIMSVRGNFFFTNIHHSAEVRITRGFLVVHYWKRGWLHRKEVDGNVDLSDGSAEPYHGLWSNTYKLAPGETREAHADWLFDPAIIEEGRALRGRAYFVDQLGNVHGTKPGKLTYRYVK